MELLWIALLIQMIFFISQDLHYLVIGFIAFSLIISFVDIRPLVFVGIPMILCQMWYIYRVESIEEGFRRRRRRKRRGKRTAKQKRRRRRRQKKRQKKRQRQIIRKKQNDLAKRNRQLRTTISNIHNISK